LNLLSDKWLTVKRRDSSEDTINFYEITADIDSNPIIDIISPRPDIKNALYQLIIGLLQVSNTPEENEDWFDYWDSPPDTNSLKEKLIPLAPFFEIDSTGIAFMQDFELKEGEEKPIASLFIESPGAKTIKDNLDHFNKRDSLTYLDPYWAATALYTMQSFAPAGGVGHRVGVRGGGPLSTLILPCDLEERPSTLWEKLWINVLSKRDIISTCKSNDYEKNTPESIFPWIKSTKISEGKGNELFPNECHPFHVYFAMPRRIRLLFTETKQTCSLTGNECAKVVTGFITKNYGNCYSGPWIHPLNAYRIDKKKPDEPPLSIKGQPGGVHYRHWLALTIGYDESIPAAVVSILKNDITKKLALRSRKTVLWAAGYDMDNMKARSWHDSIMPYYTFQENQDLKSINEFTIDVNTMIEVAGEIASNLRSAVRKAWFKEPSSPAAKKADFSFLFDSLTQNTERLFYQSIENLKNRFDKDNSKEIRSFVGRLWLQGLQKEAMSLFEQWCMCVQEGQKDLHRIFQIRREFEGWNLFGNEVKVLRAWYEDVEITKKSKEKKKRSSTKGGTTND
jgi:CRISPR system Cascade subunit CasA